MPDPEDSTGAAEDADMDPGVRDVDEDAEEPADEVAPVEPLTRDDLGGTSGFDGKRLGPIVLAAVAILLVGFIVGRVTSDDDGTAESTTIPVAPALTFPEGDQDRAAYWGFGGVTPAIADPFSRDDTEEGLGRTETGERWRVVSGSWRISDDTAAGQADGDDPAIAVVTGGSAERLTEATLTTVEEGAGIVFRYRDPGNFWSLTVAPGAGTWTATLVVEGEATVAGEVPGPVDDGTTITVAQRGAELQILVDGVEGLRITDTSLRNQARSGLIAPGGGDGSARFDRFYVGNMPV